VGDVGEDAFEIVEDAGEAGVTIMKSSLAIEAILLEEILGSALFIGDVDLFCFAVLWLGVGKFHEHHFRAAEVFADGYD